MVDRRQVAQPRLAEQGHVDREGERAQAAVGADVARGLFAPDMLLARRERQPEATLAVGIDGLAAQPPRQLANIFLLAPKQPDNHPPHYHPNTPHMDSTHT